MLAYLTVIPISILLLSGVFVFYYRKTKAQLEPLKATEFHRAVILYNKLGNSISLEEPFINYSPLQLDRNSIYRVIALSLLMLVTAIAEAYALDNGYVVRFLVLVLISLPLLISACRILSYRFLFNYYYSERAGHWNTTTLSLPTKEKPSQP